MISAVFIVLLTDCALPLTRAWTAVFFHISNINNNSHSGAAVWFLFPIWHNAGMEQTSIEELNRRYCESFENGLTMAQMWQSRPGIPDSSNGNAETRAINCSKPRQDNDHW